MAEGPFHEFHGGLVLATLGSKTTFYFRTEGIAICVAESRRYLQSGGEEGVYSFVVTFLNVCRG